MKRKIIASLLLLFLFSASGAGLATFSITNTTTEMGRLITLHQIEHLRQDLIISIQNVQSDLYTVRTMLGHKVDAIADNVMMLSGAAAACSTCHHEPPVEDRIRDVQDRIESYQRALSFYITASANKPRIDRLKLEAASIGNELLVKTEEMSFQASRTLESTTAAALLKIRFARRILFATMGVSLLLGILVAVHLTRSVTRPIRSLVTATRAIAEGDLDHTIAMRDKTEFGELAAHFNHMSVALKENYEVLTEEIKERRQAEEALRESEERYALAARGANDGLWDWDLRNNTVFYSYRWKSMLGYEEHEIGNAPDEWLGRVHPADREQTEAKIAGHIDGRAPYFECEYRIRHKDDSYRWVIARGIAVRDSEDHATRMAGSQTDITTRKQAEEQLVYDAFHDALTGLPNRALFMDRIEHVIASAKRHPAYLYAVLFIDLDRFKVINDSMGHNIGDRLLIAISGRLKSCLRPGDTVARLGGDEFAILLEDISDTTDAEDIARRIEGALAAPHTIDGHEIYSFQSIGVALRSERYEWPEQILRDADIAMYQAKSGGGARHEFFDTAMHASIIDRLQLEADLRIAVEHQQGFVLHYQPIMDLSNRTMIGFEALVRWQHPVQNVICPLEFIPLAEETGMIIPLSEWILREACHQLRLWQVMYPADPPLRMSVNVSRKVLLHQGFVELVAEILRSAELNPGSLALEITENVMMENTSAALDAMTKLQAMGVHIHLDDFGTGYSSLSYLHTFPVNALKIDRSFIAKLTGSENREIVRTIITLARNLKLDVIAEGVELDQHLNAIKDMHCQYGQGYIFAKPMVAADVENWVNSLHGETS
jgi:diguanylate cyclase (GGDEF)-like protein/PAS domain S-box-containing protein